MSEANVNVRITARGGDLLPSMAGPQPEETCPLCEGGPCFGIVREDDPRFYGGYISSVGNRHDPMQHDLTCPLYKEGLAALKFINTMFPSPPVWE